MSLAKIDLKKGEYVSSMIDFDKTNHDVFFIGEPEKKKYVNADKYYFEQKIGGETVSGGKSIVNGTFSHKHLIDQVSDKYGIKKITQEEWDEMTPPFSMFDGGSLDKQWNFKEWGVRSFKRLIDEGKFSGKYKSVENAVQFNRIKYNRMNGHEQAEYVKKLNRKTTKYNLQIADRDSSYVVSKEIYDYATLPELPEKNYYQHHEEPKGYIFNDGGSKKTGEKVENKGIDLFEDYKNIPQKVQKVLDKYEEGFVDGDYKILKEALNELEQIGYTFEYYLDGQAYDLRKIGEMGKVEYAEKHHIGLMASGGSMNDGGSDWKLKYEKFENEQLLKGGFDPASLTPEQKHLILQPSEAPENFYADGERSPKEAYRFWKERLKKAGLSNSQILKAEYLNFGKMEDGGSMNEFICSVGLVGKYTEAEFWKKFKDGTLPEEDAEKWMEFRRNKMKDGGGGQGLVNYQNELESMTDEKLKEEYESEFGVDADNRIEDEREEVIEELVSHYKRVLKSRGEMNDGGADYKWFNKKSLMSWDRFPDDRAQNTYHDLIEKHGIKGYINDNLRLYGKNKGGVPHGSYFVFILEGHRMQIHVLPYLPSDIASEAGVIAYGEIKDNKEDNYMNQRRPYISIITIVNDIFKGTMADGGSSFSCERGYFWDELYAMGKNELIRDGLYTVIIDRHEFRRINFLDLRYYLV